MATKAELFVALRAARRAYNADNQDAQARSLYDVVLALFGELQLDKIKVDNETTTLVNIFEDQMMSCQNLRDWTAMVGYAREALRHNPKSSLAYYGLALASRKLGRLDESRAAIEQSIELDPNGGPNHWEYACLLVQLGHLAEAARHAQESIENGMEWDGLWNDEELAALHDVASFRAYIDALR
ncbi:MAG: tetratricopeptide repeat protein [Kofleriaceae bacterium]